MPSSLCLCCFSFLLSHLSLGLAVGQCVSPPTIPAFLYPHVPYQVSTAPQDPTNGYYKVRGVSVSLSLGEAPGGGLFLPPPSPIGFPGAPTYYDFKPHLDLVPPCRLYRARAGYLTTPHPRAFTSYLNPTSFGPPDLSSGTPPFPYATLSPPSHQRLQTHV